MLCKAGNYRTAMEFSKLLFSLDPDTDPQACLVTLDYYAIRAAQWDFVRQLREALKDTSPGLHYMPGLMFNEALGWRLGRRCMLCGGLNLG